MTYLGLDAVFVAVAAMVVLVGTVPRRSAPRAERTGVRGATARRSRANGRALTNRRWWLATAVTGAALMVLTAVFDTVMIRADLFRYDASALIGLRIGLTPVEDLAWPLVAAVLLPALWELLGRSPRPGTSGAAVRAGAEAPGDPETHARPEAPERAEVPARPDAPTRPLETP